MKPQLPKLHPAALPKKEEAAAETFSDLLELCFAVLRSEGWDRQLTALREPGSTVVKVVEIVAGSAHWSRDPEIVFLGTDEQFAQGEISRAVVRAECVRFLRG
ncbi:MAG: hypothetical protein IT285_01445 [Bdellovibrionales bacterium]|nr:hypothetical protein [Bdellovibrionales bacterium]